MSEKLLIADRIRGSSPGTIHRRGPISGVCDGFHPRHSAFLHWNKSYTGYLPNRCIDSGNRIWINPMQFLYPSPESTGSFSAWQSACYLWHIVGSSLLCREVLGALLHH